MNPNYSQTSKPVTKTTTRQLVEHIPPGFSPIQSSTKVEMLAWRAHKLAQRGESIEQQVPSPESKATTYQSSSGLQRDTRYLHLNPHKKEGASHWNEVAASKQPKS